jgi:hypothetical protein
MAYTEFLFDDKGYVFMSDSENIATPFRLRQEVYEWAAERRMVIGYQGTFAGKDVWSIADAEDRLMFKLRWSE